MPKLLILGAGIYQVPLIQKAKEMGFYTIAASYPGPYPGLSLADKVYYTDTTDAEGILKLSRAEQIDGICTTGTDVAVKSIGFVCDALNLPGVSFNSASLATDKACMKQAFLNGGVSTASFRQVFSEKEALLAFSDLQPPVIVKATDSSGSRGIMRADTEEQLFSAYHLARTVTKKPYVLVEKFLTGHEIGIDGLLQDGEWKLFLPHDKFMYRAGNTSIPAGHSFPFPCSSSLFQEMKEQMTVAARSLGLDHCAVNADILICGSHVYLLEMGARAGATGIPELISCCTGVNYYEQIIKNAVGETVSFGHFQETPCISRLLFSPHGGTLTHVGDDILKKFQTSSTTFQLDYKEGDRIPAAANGTDRIGCIIHRGAPGQDLNSLNQELYQIVAIIHSNLFIDGISLLHYL